MLDSVDGRPAAFSGEADDRGFLGVAVRQTSTNRWVVSKSRLGDVEDEEVITFGPAQLQALFGEEVTVDIVDTYAGVWGWIAADSFVLRDTCGGGEAEPDELMPSARQPGGIGPGGPQADWPQGQGTLGDASVCAYLDSPMDMATFFDAIGTSWEWQHGHGGALFNTDPAHRDAPHVNSVLRSIPFTVDPRTSVSVGTVGGTGYLGNIDGQLANYSGWSTPMGFVGVAIRNADTDHWLISKRRMRFDEDMEVIKFDREELAVLTGRRVTVDLVDTYHGPTGWIAVHDLILRGPCLGVRFKPRPTLAPPPTTTASIDPALANKCDIDPVIAKPSLFCFSVMSPPEKQLISEQFTRRVGIFACNEYAVISRIKTSLGDDPCGSPVYTWHINVKAEQIGDLDEGATTDSYLNTATFLVAWDALFNSGKLDLHDFVAKADPDCVFFPDRLREHVKPFYGQEVFVLNCDSLDGRMYGALEVFSTSALKRYEESVQTCKSMKWQAWGEDLYMESCMRALNVGTRSDFNLVGDSRCTAAPCTDASRVAFHPYKDTASYWGCWNQGSGLVGQFT